LLALCLPSPGRGLASGLITRAWLEDFTQVIQDA